MANQNTPSNTGTKTPRAKRAPVSLVERVKTLLTTAMLRSKVTVPELEALESHVSKLKALLS